MYKTKTQNNSSVQYPVSSIYRGGFTQHSTFRPFALLRNNGKLSAGFTLVEMIVAVFIFSVVMIVAATSVVTMLDANRKAQATKTVMNNLNFALDAMTRAIRVGTNYSCSGDCPSGVDNFSFVDSDGVAVTYQLNKPKEGPGQIVRDRGNTGTFLPVTSPDVDVSILDFYLESGGQPRVLVIIRGTAGKTSRTEVTFNLQTLITQRFLQR